MYREPDPPTGSCPRCHRLLQWVVFVGNRYKKCPTCAGIWLDRRMLDAMWQQMEPGAPPPVLTPRIATTPPRPCPTCRGDMLTVALLTIPLDCCARDEGVWFDPTELPVALAAASLPLHKWHELFMDLVRKMT